MTHRATSNHGTSGAHGTRPQPWAGALATSPASSPPIRHCWYDGPHGRQAALLLEWRQIDGCYHGRIVVAASEPSGWAVVEIVVQAELLAPL